MFGFAWISVLLSRLKPVRYRGGPLDLPILNEKFVAANKALAKGNTDGLRAGIAFLIDCLPVSGDYAVDLGPAIQFLYGALEHHERADTKGPWNRDLSGYGLFSWRNDLYDREIALQNAWPHIEKINNALRAKSLGWHY